MRVESKPQSSPAASLAPETVEAMAFAASKRLHGAGKQGVGRAVSDLASCAASLQAQQQHAAHPNPRVEHRAAMAIERLQRAIVKNGGSSELTPALRAQVVSVVNVARYRMLRATHDTSVELEQNTSPLIMDVIEPKNSDGSIRPILEAGGKAPKSVRDRAAGRPIAEVLWSELDATERRELVSLNVPPERFMTERSMPGVRFREELPKDPTTTVTLGNQTYGPGTTSVSVRDVLMRHVEYSSPSGAPTAKNVEMHVRQSGPASHNIADAHTVSRLLGSSHTLGHIHAVHTYPRAILRGERLARLAFVDFFARANVAADLRRVLEGGVLVPRTTETDGSLFLYLSAGKVVALNDHLLALGRGEVSELEHNDLKMASIGFRTGALYGDERLFGLEFRALDTARPEDRRLADVIQRAVLTGWYGASERRFALWAEGALPMDPPEEARAIRRMHYNRPLKELLAQAPKAVRNELTSALRRKLQLEVETHQGLKMLLHDWSTSSVLAGRPVELARVEKAQAEALKSYAQDLPMAHVVRQFARDAGLYELYADSLGMNDPSLAH